MYPEFNSQSPEPFAVRNIPDQNLVIGGFNTWWQKTAGQNMAMVTKACDLMREHRRVSSDVQESTAFALKTKET